MSRAVDACNLHDTLHCWAPSDSGSVEQMAGRGHNPNGSISHALPQQWTQNRSMRHLRACPCECAWMEGIAQGWVNLHGVIVLLQSPAMHG